jgi:hypothetical protein
MKSRPVVTGHSSFGPSSLKACVLCPGRAKANKGLTDVQSFAAAEGTVAHKIGERCLMGKTPPDVGETIQEGGYNIVVDQAMLDAVQFYVDHINDIRAKVSGYLYEEEVEVSDTLEFLGLPEVFGTCDYSAAVMFDTLYIRDYKHGQGITVPAKYNYQLMAYALIMAQDDLTTYRKISLGIVQPRAKDGERLKEWTTTPAALITWFETVLKPTVQLGLSDNPPRIPGEEQCRWCKAKETCPEFAKQALTVAQADFADYAEFTPDKIVDSVPIEKVIHVYDKLPLLKTFIKAVENRIYSTLSRGEQVNGYKLVNGRRSRSWNDDVEAEKTTQGSRS